MSTKVAVITGGNRGVGFYITKGLCERFQGIVYLTSRDETRGLEAVKRLEELGLKLKYHQLDVTKKDSIKRFANYINETYGGLDLIVNNASAFMIENPVPTYEQALTLVNIEYGGIKNVSEILYPLLRKNARVVNLSSNDGQLSGIFNEDVRKKLSNHHITKTEIDEIVESVLQRIKSGNLSNEEKEKGYIDYRIGKAAAYALSVIYSKELASKDISINMPHPGFCQTEASKFTGTMTAEQGASSALYAALDAPQNMTGKFIWCNNDVVDWYDASIPCTELLHLTKNDPTPYPNMEIPTKDKNFMTIEMLAKSNS